MKINNTASTDLLDILFANRNKSYGAYQLRKNYNKRLLTAVLVMMGTCMLLSMLYKLQAARQMIPSSLFSGTEVTLESTPKELPPVVQPPQAKPVHAEPVHIATIQVTQPRIVADKQVETPPAKQDDIEGLKIDVATTAGSVRGDDVMAPPVNVGTGNVEGLIKEENYEVEFTNVQIQARFSGGPDAWKKYLEKNLRSETPTENGASVGTYTVVVSFLVDKQGAISEVKAENDPGYGTTREAVRVIQRGPIWIPAVQNGHNVIYRQKQAITFVVAEQE